MPSALVSAARSASVQVTLSPLVRPSAVSRLAPPSSVSVRSPMVTPATASLNTMAALATVLLRGSGVMLATSAVGAVVSMVTESAEEAADWLPAASVALAVMA